MTLSVITSYESKMKLLMNTDTGMIYVRDMEFIFNNNNNNNFKFHIILDVLRYSTDRIRICDENHDVLVSISSKSPIYLNHIFRELCSYGFVKIIFEYVNNYIKTNKRTYIKYELKNTLDHLIRERFLYDFEIKCG